MRQTGKATKFNSFCGRHQKRTARKPLLSFIMSVLSAVILCAGFAGATYAWFIDISTVSSSDVEAGLMAVEVLNVGSDISGEPTPATLTDITADNPVFNLTELALGTDIYSYIAVVNEGSLNSEYNIGFTIEEVIDPANPPEFVANLGDIIDVFYTVVTPTNMLKESEITPESYEFIYLGKLSDVSTNTDIYLAGPGTEETPNPAYLDVFENQTVRIKGRLDYALPAPEEGEEPRHLTDYICIRLKLPETAQQKYQGLGLSLKVELNAINSIEDNLINVITATNDESMGLLLGGGTYYKGHTFILDPVPEEGYKFSYWEDRDGNRIELPLYTDETSDDKEDRAFVVMTEDMTEDLYYKAVFVKESEYEEQTTDPIFDDDPEEGGC